MKIDIHPLGAELFVVEDTTSSETTSEGGLFLPGQTQKHRHIVKYAGPLASIKPGTRVVINPSKMETPPEIDGIPYIVVDELDRGVLAVVEEISD